MTVRVLMHSIVVVLVCLFLAAAPVRSQDTTRAGENEVVILNHADSLIGLVLEGERARQLVGNVQFTHGTTVVTCDRAVQYLESNRVQLEGEVIIRDDTMALYTYRGMYYSEDRVAEGFDNVRLVDGQSTLRARYGKYFAAERKAYFKTSVTVDDDTTQLSSNELTYYREEERMVADGNVRIVNRENRTTLFGEHFENDRKRKFSLMTTNPRATQIDSAGEGKFDTLYVRSERMESYQDSIPRLVATGDVAMKRGTFAAEAGQSVFFTKVDSIEMRRSPVVWFAQTDGETTQVSGDSIFVRLANRKLDVMYVRGSAFAAAQADSLRAARFNQMSGQDIIIRFSDNTLRQIDIDKTATMMYYLYDGLTANGLNITTGDHGTITFIEKKIDAIKMRGGVEGEYHPENLVRGKETEFNLAGLKWRAPRREYFAVFR